MWVHLHSSWHQSGITNQQEHHTSVFLPADEHKLFRFSALFRACLSCHVLAASQMCIFIHLSGEFDALTSPPACFPCPGLLSSGLFQLNCPVFPSSSKDGQ